MINLDHIVKKYKNKGWVKITSFLTKKEVYKLKVSIEKFLKNNHHKYKGRDINYTGKIKEVKFLNSFHKMQDCNQVNNLARKLKKKFLLYRLLKNSKPELRACEYFAKPAKIGLKVPVHQDNYFWKVKKNNALTVWLALTNSSKKNGSLEYYEGSHRIGLIKHEPSFAKGTSLQIKNKKILKNYKKVSPTLSPGDILIHHVMIAHGSNPNNSIHPRKGLTFQYKDKNSKYDVKKIKQYKEHLKNHFKIIQKKIIN